MPWIRTLAVIFTLFSTAALAQPVIRDGKEWLQPVDFVNLSWDDVAAVCDPGTGACSGTLGTTDVTGYTWASVDEVSGLFNAYGVTPPLSGADVVTQAGSSWAPSFLDQFHPSYNDGQSEYVWGGVRTLAPDPAFHLCPYIEDYADAAFDDTASTEEPCRPYTRFTYIGVWLFRPVSNSIAAPVPTVPTYVLIFTVLGLLAIATRGLSRRNAREG